MTENGDQLSQWRGYCPQGLGVSIGFEGNLFERHCIEDRARFAKCIYEPRAKIAVIETLLEDLEKFIRALERLDVDSLSKAFAEFATALFFRGAYLKDESFAEECERRYSSAHSSVKGRTMKNWKFRESSLGLIPYIELPFAPGPIPIKEIIVSPSEDSGRQVRAIERYLRTMDLACEHIRPSRIPFRYGGS
jgi:hypothetical protein